MKRFVAWLTGLSIRVIAWLVTAVRAVWEGVGPSPEQRVYFANHRSNGDFVLIWSVLPSPLRAQVRPVAAADYWLSSRVRRFLIGEVFNGVLIERDPARRREDPVEQMRTALDEGASLILFPEGTRNTTDARLLPLRSGLYHLARARPDLPLVPVWIENLNRVLPKGEVVPLPLICTVTFGAPIRCAEGEGKAAFLARARAALLVTAPEWETAP